VGVVLVTVLTGFDAGLAWAFVAGLTANLVGREPLGSIPLELIAACLVTAAAARAVGRPPVLTVLVAALAGSVVVDLLGLGILRLLGSPPAGPLPVERLALAAGLNALIAVLLFVPVRVMASRLAPSGGGSR
jgi:cell shape-determining protein MreD